MFVVNRIENFVLAYFEAMLVTRAKRFSPVNQAESLVCEAKAFKTSKQLFGIIFPNPNYNNEPTHPES